MSSYQKEINSGIKRLREANNLTQEKFAERIGLSTQGLRNLEQNKYQPTADTIDAICNAFNITPIDLLLPDINAGTDNILEIINTKLKICSNDELNRINDIIDVIRKTYR